MLLPHPHFCAYPLPKIGGIIMLRQAVAGLAIAIACASPAASQPDPSTCTDLTVEKERLACYDGLFMDQIQDATPEGDIGDWRIRTVVSPIDDTSNVFLSLTGRDGIRSRFGQSGEMKLTIACRENTTSLYLHFGGHFMSDHAGAGRVTYRIDTDAAQTKNFTGSTNNEALGLWNGGSSIPFVKALFGAEQLFVQATPYSENAVQDFFDIGGLETAIEPLRASCNW